MDSIRFRDIRDIMEDQMEKDMEQEIGIGNI